MLARLFVIVGGLFVLVLIAALAVPPFIDWKGYRADFEREASAVLGRKVTVRGDATARLLPFPSVTFSDVEVAGGPDGQPAMTVETFSMDAELAPFLSGEVLIFDMRLVRPKGTIDVGADGAIDWTVRPSSPFDASQISIEKLTITDGEIELHHGAGGRNHVLSEINSTVSAKSLVGPWRLDGSLLFDGLRSAVTASTGQVSGDGQLRLRLRLDPEAYPLTIETDGNARVENGALLYAGQFKMLEDDKGEVTLRDGSGEAVKVSDAKAEPGYRMNGKFNLDHKQLAIDEFRFETGPLDNPYTADGTASIDYGDEPRFRIEASGAQVQFDEAVGAEAKSGLTLAERVSGLEKALQKIPRPTIPGSVEVKLPAVVAGDTTIRDVHFSAEPAEGGWTVHSLGATLPGRSTLEAAGKLSTGDAFGFRGSLLLAVAQPSGFAAWLSKDVDEAIRRLPGAGFKADVDITNGQQTFSNLELILGKAKFNGSIEAKEPGEARPSVAMQLKGGQLDVEGLAAFASIFVSDKGANRFADHDLDFQIVAGPVDAGGMTADKVDTQLRLREGVLEVDRLAVTGLAGASISATGRIKDFPASPTGNLDATVVAVDLAPLINVAAERYPGNAVAKGLAERAKAYGGLFEDARIDLVTSAAENGDGTTGLAISAQGAAGGSAFSATLSAQGKMTELAKAPLALTFNARNDDATALLALYGLPALPLGLTGAGATDVAAKGTLGEGLATTASMSGEDFKAGFDGSIAVSAQGPALKGKVSLEAADIEPWLMTTGVALPGMGTGTSTTFNAEADYANGLLVLGGLTGAVNEIAVSGDINAAIRGGKPLLTGALVVDEVDLDPAAVMLFGDASFAQAPKGWPTAPFAQASAVPFNAELDISTATLAAGRFATAYDAAFSVKLNDDGLRVSSLKAKLFGGELSGMFDLKNTDGTGLLNGQMTVSGADLSAALPNGGISGSGNFSSSVSTSGKSVDGMIAALSGSGTATLKGVTVENLNADALPAFLAKADEIGRDINAAQTAAFAPEIAAQGSFPAQDADIAFTVANGILRAPPVTFANAASQLTADLSADLAAGTVAARGTIAYKAGDDALVGSEPALNFAIEGTPAATTRSFDSAPLAQFLTQRALEKEQQRVEAMQAVLLEKQRLRREARYYAALQTERERAAEELRRQEEARLKAEAEAKAAEEARLKAEAEAKAAAEAEAAAKAEAEARAADEAVKAEADQKAREEAERQKAEQAMREAEAERARLEAERNKAPQLPGVERKPLPPANDNAPAQGTAPQQNAEPFSLENLLKSLDGG